MSEENKKKTSANSGSASRSGTSRSSSSRSSASGSRSTGSSAKKSSSAGSSSGGAKKSTSSSGTSSKIAASRSASSKAGSAQKNSTQKKASQSSSAKTSSSAKKTTSSGSRSAPKKRSYDDVPYNPRRDAQDERDLHNSPAAKRILEERRRKKYNKNRRLHTIAFYSAITVAVISVVIILSVTVLFNIESITVERGRNIEYTDAEIIAACGVEPGDNLFAIDSDQVALNVTTNLPYIEVCNISRKLPSTLELDVHSAVVLGKITTTNGAYVVLSASGRALEYADAYDGAPIAQLNGMNMTFDAIGLPMGIEDPDQLDIAAELVVGYSLYGLTLDSITFESSGSVTVSYDGRIRIKIGVPTNLSQKIQVSASMITEGKIAKNESGTLDLSIDERAVFSPDYLQNND